MADYYPLLARALDALPDRSPALRKAVYDRARGALIAQLRSLDPPVAEADIDLERNALDAAIERLEVDYGEPAPAAEPPAASAPKPSAPEPAALKPAAPEPTPGKPEPTEPVPSEAAKASAATGARPDDASSGNEPSAPPPPPSPETAAAPPPPKQREKAPEPQPAPPPPAAPTAQPLPEAGPPPDFVPFVPPPRRPKTEAPAPSANGAPSTGEAVPAGEDAAAIPPPDPAGASRRPRIDVVKPRGRSRLLRNAVVGGILALVIGLIAVAAFMLRDQPAELSPSAENQDGTPSEQAESKFADRVGGAEPERRAPARAKPQPEVTVAQQAILYDENTADPRATPKATQGRAVWRLEPVSGEQGQPLQNAVRATVDYPDAGFSLVMTIRKNLDATLPASHTVELAFSGQGDERTVQEVGLPQMKDEQNGRGAPLSGLPVRVRDNLFLIGLSNLPADIERNMDLLIKKNWIDLGVRFKSGPRAVLSFDKGTAGTQVMQSAFDQWKP